MKRIYGMVCAALLLTGAGGVLQGCEEDIPDVPGRDELIRQGRYMKAVNWGSYASDINMEARPFEEGTPYRLVAFSKAYYEGEAQLQTPATYPRFNKVAWEGQAPNGLHFMNIDSDPSKWFGFQAIGNEEAGDDGLVSLDFYGFTYGVPKTDHTDTTTYIQLEGWYVNNKTPDLKELKHTETVPNGGKGELNDLMRGELLNQNISTAGVAGTDADGNQIPTFGTQSVMPFRHCFSKLHFQVSQQAKVDETDANGNPIPAFPDLKVVSVDVTNTYAEGTVTLHDGKVKLEGDPVTRPLTLDQRDHTVNTNNTDLGEIIVFPSDGAALSEDSNMPDGYKVGLKITVKSTVKADIENMLTNTDSPDKTVTEKKEDDGKMWYSGTIVKNEIIDYYTNVSAPDRALYLKQNTSYMLIITFQKDAVRIITVIPMVEEWLPGEGTPQDPWQYQAIGRPQMFDNILWSDRNLGADHYDARGEHFEECVGYFYQPGRNIPYYPYNYWNYPIFRPDGSFAEDTVPMPDINNKLAQDLANGNSSYANTRYRFFPIVDSRILTMREDFNRLNADGKKLFPAIKEWSMVSSGYDVQLYIPESKPEGKYFTFAAATWKDGYGLTDQQTTHWELGASRQPLTGAWEIPTSQQFLSIFPSTPHAGNITFRVGGDNEYPMSWDPAAMNDNVKVLRVTVPYYYPGMTAPAKSNASAKYTEAWNTLKGHNDKGCSSLGYFKDPGYGNNPNCEPDGDPEDGFASVYVISREEGHVEAPAILQTGDWAVRQWGTIYAMKRIYTSEAYRMRWRVFDANNNAKNPSLYIEICRYRCDRDDTLDETNYMKYDWNHPVATMYMPIGGLGDWTGAYINFGTECQYGTSDPIVSGKTGAVQIKLTGHDAFNCYIAVVRGVINRTFGMQIRPIRIGGGVNNR